MKSWFITLVLAYSSAGLAAPVDAELARSLSGNTVKSDVYFDQAYIDVPYIECKQPGNHGADLTMPDTKVGTCRLIREDGENQTLRGAAAQKMMIALMSFVQHGGTVEGMSDKIVRAKIKPEDFVSVRCATGADTTRAFRADSTTCHVIIGAQF